MSLWPARRCLEILLSFATDSRYSSTGIDSALRAAYPQDRPFFHSGGGGCNVAVVATTTEDSSTCIFTNYNGPKERFNDCGELARTVIVSAAKLEPIGYKIVRPADPSNEMAVWQAYVPSLDCGGDADNL
jgi:hypothetical protein